MDKNISEIFDYGDEIVVVKEQDNPLDPARIKELTMKKIESGAIQEEIGKTVKKARPVYRTVLIAAVVAILLIGTAFAVYQITIRDTLTGESETREVEVWNGAASGEPEFVEVERLEKSLNGLVTSPEYQAYAEWKAWNEDWSEKNPDPWGALGVDDSYHETPDNYAYYYDAYFTVQAEKLDEIVGKYGLALHTVRAPFDTEEELCDVLGVREIWRGEHETIEGYVYDDGTFHLVSRLNNDPLVKSTVWLTVDGSFTMIGDAILPDYEEWSYVTADGTPVALILENAADYPQTFTVPSTARIAAKLDEAMVSVSISGIETKEALEDCADRLNLSGLAEVFSAKTDRSYIPAAAAAQQTAFREAQEAFEAEQERRWQAQKAYQNQHTSSEWGEIVRAELGDYSLPETLEGQHLASVTAHALPTWFAVEYYYSDDSYEGMERYTATYEFRCERDWSDETHTQSTTQQEFEELLRIMQEDGIELEIMDIGGYELYVNGPIVMWYDAGRDLLFSINDCHPAYDPNPFTQEQIAGLAEGFIASINAD